MNIVFKKKIFLPEIDNTQNMTRRYHPVLFQTLFTHGNTFGSYEFAVPLRTGDLEGDFETLDELLILLVSKSKASTMHILNIFWLVDDKLLRGDMN